MSDHELPGTGTAIPPITSTLITLLITGNEALTEVSVSVRKAGRPINSFYDPQARTANARLLSADFQALSAAVANGGSVSINYIYRDPDFSLVSFLWQAIAKNATSTVPQSGVTSKAATESAVPAAQTG